MKKLTMVGIVLLFALILSACSSQSPTAAPVTNEPAVVETEPLVSVTEPVSVTADGKTLLEERCVSCHGIERTTSETGSLSQWTRIVDRMIGKGAQLTDAEKAVLIQYLADTYK